MQWLLLGLALIFANLPLLIFRKSNKFSRIQKITIWLIWFLAYFALLLMGYFLEQQATGKNQNQGWEFYSITFLIYLIFSYPALMKLLFANLKSKI